jgi:hypothetical protein
MKTNGSEIKKEEEIKYPRTSLRSYFLIAILAPGLFLFYHYSQKNSQIYILRCEKGRFISIHKGIFFPFGSSEFKKGPYAGFELPKDMPCEEGRFTSKDELDEAIGSLLLNITEREIADPSHYDLQRSRNRLQKVSRLRGLNFNQRIKLRLLLGTLAYREGMNLIRGIERQLRAALLKLKEAQRLGAKEVEDIDELIERIKEEIQRFSQTGPLKKEREPLRPLLKKKEFKIKPKERETPPKAPSNKEKEKLPLPPSGEMIM